jgi:hypothetical protein
LEALKSKCDFEMKKLRVGEEEIKERITKTD